MRAGHADIRQARRAPGQNTLVGGLHVRVRADDGGDLAVEVPAECHLLGGRFGVNVDEDHLRALVLDAGDLAIRGAEGVVDGVEKHAAHDVDDTDLHAAAGERDERAVPWCALRIVGGTNHPRLVHDELQRLALVPHVIAGRDHVNAGPEDLVGVIARDAIAAGGILAIGNHQVHAVRRREGLQVLAQQVASGPRDDVTNEEQLHSAAVGALVSIGITMPWPRRSSRRGSTTRNSPCDNRARAWSASTAPPMRTARANRPKSRSTR